MKSYIINAPNNLVACYFTKSSFDKANRRKCCNFAAVAHKKWPLSISNENSNSKIDITNIPRISEYQNFNGILFHSSVQRDKIE